MFKIHDGQPRIWLCQAPKEENKMIINCLTITMDYSGSLQKLSDSLALSVFFSQWAWNESEFEPAGSSPLSSVLLSPAPLSSRQDCQLQFRSLRTTWALEGHRTAFRPQQQGSSLPVGTLWGLGVQGQPGLSWRSGFMQEGDIEGCLRVLLKSGFSQKLLACPIKSLLRSISLSQFAFLLTPLSFSAGQGIVFHLARLLEAVCLELTQLWIMRNIRNLNLQFATISMLKDYSHDNFLNKLLCP